MRTTLTLDRDIAARLQRLRQHGGQLKEVVNRALRHGLDHLDQKPGKLAKSYRLRPVRLKPRRVDFDNIADVLAEIEGDTNS